MRDLAVKNLFGTLNILSFSSKDFSSLFKKKVSAILEIFKYYVKLNDLYISSITLV